MPRGKNVVVLEGNITRDPELRFTNNGTPVCTISMATNTESRKKSDGEWEDLAQFHRVVVWGPQGEDLGQNGKQGDGLEVLGMLTQRSWEQDGQKRYITEVKASVVKLRPKDGRRQNQGAGQGQGNGYAPPAGDDQDIPF